ANSGPARTTQRGRRSLPPSRGPSGEAVGPIAGRSGLPQQTGRHPQRSGPALPLHPTMASGGGGPTAGRGTSGATGTRAPDALEESPRPGQESFQPGVPLPANGPAGPSGGGLPQEHDAPG